MTAQLVLIDWTIRLSLVLMAAGVAGRLLDRTRQARGELLRGLWTAGWCLAVLHVLFAFAFVHDWSHARAVAETARRTAEQIGWEFGGGTYFNYAFLVVWGADVAWTWYDPAGYRRRSPFLTAGVVGYLLLIAFNGAVVFESGPTRWLGIALFTGLAVLGLGKLRRARQA